jgi:hypothetical protein
MASFREQVFLAGRIIGMGRDESCMISATKVSLPGSGDSMYTDMSIQNAPANLPDGGYTVHYKAGSESKAEAVKRQNGYWLAAGL